MKGSAFCNRVLAVALSVALFFSSFIPAFADVADWADKFFSFYPNIYSVIKTVSTQTSADNFAKLNTSAAAWRKVIKDYNIPKDELRELFDICWNADSNTFISKYGDSAYSNHFDNCQNLVKVTISTLGSTSLDDFFNVSLYGNSGAELDGDNNVKVPVPALKDHIQTTDKLYYPKNATGKISYRTDERWSNYVKNSNSLYRESELYVGSGWKFSSIGGGDDMYMVLFQNFGGEYYYSKYQLHFFVTAEDIYYEDRDEVEYTNYTLNLEYWDMVDGSQDRSTTVVIGSKENYSYFTYHYDTMARIVIHCYDSYNNFLNYFGTSLTLVTIPDFNVYYKTDLSCTIYFDNAHFRYSPSLHTEAANCTYNGNCDMGYVASTTPLNTFYAIDTSKIPDNYYVTISNDNTTGDTIYNYTLVNPETGQKDTIQNFITNNYTFTTNNEGDNSGGGSGGGLGGDVKVGGNVEVGGRVDIGGQVDINVNVNGSGNGNGNDISNDSEFEGNLNDYIQYIPEVSEGFIDYLKNFFSWLPPPVFGILMLGLIVSVWCRWRGR